jgi:FHS family L-fucose permease-like MFS transporter
LFLAFVLFVIAAVFALIKLPKIEAATGSTSTDGVSLENKYSSAWSYRHLVFGAIGIFVYVGAEVSIGSFLVNYLGQPFVAGLKEADAGKLVSLYWGGAMVGRFIGSAIQRKVKPGTVLAVNAIVATVLIILTMVASSKAAVLLHTNGSHVNLALVIFMGKIAMWSILAIGLFNSIMFPTIFTLAIDGLGKHTGEGSGILCMAIVGGAIIPLLQGVLADRVGIQHAFVLPVLCYLYIAYYGVKGHIPHFKN